MITLADGSQRAISEIVDGSEPVEVLSYDAKEGVYITKHVTGWFKNPAKKKDWVKMKARPGRGCGNTKGTLEMTWNHPVLTQRGWVEAQNLKDHDVVYKNSMALTEAGKQAVLGTYLGDGSIDERYVLRISHCVAQEDYIRFTAQKLNFNIRASTQRAGYGAGLGVFKGLCSLGTIFPEIKQLRRKGIKATPEVLSRLGTIGLAFWYMDDGHLCRDHRYPDYHRAQLHTEGMSSEELENIRDYFRLAWNINIRIYDRNNTSGKTVRLDKSGSEIFFGLVAPYIVPSMRYKLPEKFRNIPFVLNDMDFLDTKLVPLEFSTRAITDYSPSKRNRKKYYTRYDIKVEDTHCFFANGFLVHNCDGGGGTPDLRGEFIVGAGGAYSPGDTGGGASANLTHNHAPGTLQTDSDDHTHGPGTLSTNIDTHSHGPGNLSTNTDTHSHGPGTLETDSDTHSHGPGTLETDNDTHSHTADGTLTAAASTSGQVAMTDGSDHWTRDSTHTHDVTGSTSGDTHDHAVDAGLTASDSHDHTVDAGLTATDAHSHTVNAGLTATDAHSHTVTAGLTANYVHDHMVTAGLTADALGAAVDIRPPYYALCYIMYTG